jgi:hypothetical protein
VLCCGLLAVLAAGCARPTEVARPASLHGRVTARGKPLAFAMVYAVSKAAPAAFPASAKTGKDGAYAMDGVPAGRVWIAVVLDGPPDAARPAFDAKYGDWRTSGLAADVVAGDQTLDLAVE